MPSLRGLLRALRALRSGGWRPAALLGRPLRRFHPQLGRVVRIPGGEGPRVTGPHPFADEAVWHLSGRRTEFAVPGTAGPGTARAMCPTLEAMMCYQVGLPGGWQVQILQVVAGFHGGNKPMKGGGG
eukprot:Skav200080  [mRNA]  locus=scaffold4413:67945:69116:- [translate_table: standard]